MRKSPDEKSACQRNKMSNDPLNGRQVRLPRLSSVLGISEPAHELIHPRKDTSHDQEGSSRLETRGGKPLDPEPGCWEHDQPTPPLPSYALYPRFNKVFAPSVKLGGIVKFKASASRSMILNRAHT